ncbi:MAG: FecR domain-containing protein [Gammaproteobacteria bacterium]
MGESIPFRRRTLASFVAAACGAVPAVQAATRAANVDFVVGKVSATAQDGSSRALNKGAVVQVGDTIETGEGRAWLRFTDGGYMSLQPGTEFRVDEYRFEGEDDTEEKGFFSLLKGGMRAISGFVGHRNRDAYRVNTPVATIGIRGTEYLAQLGDSLTVSCGEGVCVVANEAGEVVLQAGQTVYMKDNQSRGERLTRKVVLPPNAPVQFTQGELRDGEGDPLPGVDLPAPPLPPEEPEFVFSDDVPLQPGADQPGLYLGLSYGGEDGNFTDTSDARVDTGIATQFVTARFDNDLILQRADWSDDPNNLVPNQNVVMNASDSDPFDIDTDGVIGWGRWSGDTVDGTLFGDGELRVDESNWSIHYVVGAPTPESDLAQLRATNVVAVYDLIGATTPTFGDDGFEGGFDFGDIVSISGALAANFGQSTVQTSLVLDFTENDITINSGALPIAAGAGGVFGGSGGFASSTLAPGHPFSTSIQGFFVGGGASRAGYAYEVYIDAGGGSDYPINGVAAFKQGGGGGVIAFDPPPDL